MKHRLYISALVLVLLASCGGKDEASDVSRRLEERLEALKSIPYTSMTEEGVREDVKGVTLFDRDRAWAGYNFYTARVVPEAFLLDMDGNVVNRWSHEQDQFRYWDYAILLEGGDIIATNKFWYIFRLDWNSNLVWEQKRPAHHDIAQAEDGTLYVIELNTEMHRGLAVRFSRIAHLTAEGEEIDIWSTHDRLEYLKQVMDTRSFLDTVLDSMIANGISPDTATAVQGKLDKARIAKDKELFDYFHLNTVSLLPDTPVGQEDPRFAEGNLLICFRNVNQIAVLDWETGDILWHWGEGELEWPHHPTMLPSGNILIFDNGAVRGYSRVLEFNPLTEAIEWEYRGEPAESFFSSTRGSSQRFPNGNTLICESNNGRAFEVTPEGDIVWEWYNPMIDRGRRVQVYRMLRYPSAVVEPLLE